MRGYSVYPTPGADPGCADFTWPLEMLLGPQGSDPDLLWALTVPIAHRYLREFILSHHQSHSATSFVVLVTIKHSAYSVGKLQLHVLSSTVKKTFTFLQINHWMPQLTPD